MRFLLDENIPKDVAVALREEGHDVVWLSETARRGASDEAVWLQAAQEERVLLTADLDFPLPGPRPPGMVLVRGFERVSTAALTALLLEAIRSVDELLAGHLVIVSPGHIRVRKL